jgi:signal transduction histidine kinase
VNGVLMAGGVVAESVTVERPGLDLAYRDDGIMVEVTDDGPGALADGEPGAAAGAAGIPGGGAGLAGLRERARLLGGQLEAGSAAERGFMVRAFLPGPP